MTSGRRVSADDRRRFWERLEATRERVDARLAEVARGVPSFAPFLDAPPEVQAAQSAASRERQRAALLDGDWDAYLSDLRAQAGGYAALGVEFGDWYEIVRAMRTALLDEMLPSESAALRGELSAMDELLERSMAEMGSAYIAAKEALVRRAESQLRIYLDAIEGATVGVVIYRIEDPSDRGSFRLIAANRCAVAANPTLGTSLGRTLSEFAPEFAAGPELETWARIAATREPESWEQRDRSGSRWVHVRGFALPEQHLCLMFEDVTEQRRLEQTIARQVAELERSNRDLDEFAYVTSHDLRSPLQDVRNLAQWIDEDAREHLPEPSRQHLSRLQDRIGRMERLLDDLLEYSRVGRATDAARAFTFGEVVDEVLALSPLPPGSRVEVEGREVVLEAPRVPLEKVLRNLVSNAIKHHDGPAVALALGAVAGADRVTISVADDGPGIAPEYHDRIFRMFQTLRPRDEVEASGVGLAIVKKAVEVHGGRVSVRSEGRGTRMVFDWPRRSRAKEAER